MDDKDRIDKLIAQKYNISRTDACLLITQGKVFLGKRKIFKTHSKISLKELEKINIDQETIESLDKIKEQEKINIEEEKLKSEKSEITEKAEQVELPIVYKDDDIIIINKPKNLVVYSGVGEEKTSVVNILKEKYSLSDLGGEDREGIVHRLDKDTTGLLLVALNNNAHNYYKNLFSERKMQKEYIALVRGRIQETKGKIDMPIARSTRDFKKMETTAEGKEAITYFEVLERFKNHTLVKINIETGRTHQIRVHFSKIGYPVVGDRKYSKGKNDFDLDSQLLHAYSLKFVNTKNKEIEVVQEIPKEFENILKYLKTKN